MSSVPPPDNAYPQDPYAQGQLSTSGLAVTALILGVLGICIPLLGIVALILGIVAVNQIGRPQNRLKGHGFAITGMVLGSIGIVTMFISIGILLPTLGAARSTALRMKSNSRARGIHQACIQYAQGNNDQYPGLGNDNDPTVEGRFQLLLDRNFFTGEYLISPAEDKSLVVPGGKLTTANYSYALLEIATKGGRQTEWAQTLNSEAPVISDRNTGRGPGAAARSVHSDTEWRGSVAYNDNHTLFETSSVLLRSTKFGAARNTNDDLFSAAGPNDAYMIYSGKQQSSATAGRPNRSSRYKPAPTPTLGRLKMASARPAPYA